MSGMSGMSGIRDWLAGSWPSLAPKARKSAHNNSLLPLTAEVKVGYSRREVLNDL